MSSSLMRRQWCLKKATKRSQHYALRAKGEKDETDKAYTVDIPGTRRVRSRRIVAVVLRQRLNAEQATAGV